MYPSQKSQAQRDVYPLLWIAVVLLAALVRLADLTAAPLNSAEAVQALAAYKVAVQHTPPTDVQSLSPLLWQFNILLFTILGSGEWLVRLLPALAGVGLALTPLLLQHYIGRWGSLGMALLLALSPHAILSSRTLDGTTPALVGIMLLFGCTAAFLNTTRPRLLTFAALGLAIALASGPAGWAALISLLLASGGVLWVWREQAEWIWPLAKPLLGRGLLVAGLSLLLLGTGLGLNPSGLIAVGGQFAAFLGRFSRPTPPVFSPVQSLLVYEPLILLVGLIGLVVAVVRRHGMGLLLAFWAAIAWLQVALMPSRQPADLLWALLPLAGLAGLVIEEAAATMALPWSWQTEGIYLPISLALWAYLGQVLAIYARSGGADKVPRMIASILFQLLLLVAFGVFMAMPETEEDDKAATIRRGIAVTLRSGGLALALVMLAITFSVGWRLNHLRPADPREISVLAPSAVGMRALPEVIEQVAEQNLPGGALFPVTLLGEADPALAWALRDFDVQTVQTLQEQPPLVVAPATDPLPAGYFAEVFTLGWTWSPVFGSRTDQLRWLLYRETTVQPTPTLQVKLWVREDLGTAMR